MERYVVGDRPGMGPGAPGIPRRSDPPSTRGDRPEGPPPLSPLLFLLNQSLPLEETAPSRESPDPEDKEPTPLERPGPGPAAVPPPGPAWDLSKLDGIPVDRGPEPGPEIGLDRNREGLETYIFPPGYTDALFRSDVADVGAGVSVPPPDGGTGGEDTSLTPEGETLVEAPGRRPSSVMDAPNILIAGCGGGGGNMVGVLDAMGLPYVKTLSINTDRLHLEEVRAQRKVLVGKRLAGGMGTGGDETMGRACAESCEGVLEPMVREADLVVALTSLGGGTGTGATPLLCGLARETGATVIVVATLPFRMESTRREKALKHLPALRESADNVLLFDQDHLMRAVPDMPVEEALEFMNQLIAEVVRGLVEVTTRPSRINIDFADLRSVLTKGGLSQVLIGEVFSTDPAVVADATLDNPFAELDHKTATGALIHITGGETLTLHDAQRIADLLTLPLGDEAEVILGARIEPDMRGRVKVIALFTGIELDGDLAIPDEGAPASGGARARKAAEASVGTQDIFAQYGVTLVGEGAGGGPEGTGPLATLIQDGDHSYISLSEFRDDELGVIIGRNTAVDGPVREGPVTGPEGTGGGVPGEHGGGGGAGERGGPAPGPAGARTPPSGFIKEEPEVDERPGPPGSGGVFDDIMIS